MGANQQDIVPPYIALRMTWVVPVMIVWTANEGYYDMAKESVRDNWYIDVRLCFRILSGESIQHMPEGVHIQDSLKLHTAAPYMDKFSVQNCTRDLWASIFIWQTNFQVFRCPNPSSVLTNTAKYWSLTKQIHRLAFRCSLWPSFIYISSVVVHTMISTGYQKGKSGSLVAFKGDHKIMVIG